MAVSILEITTIGMLLLQTQAVRFNDVILSRDMRFYNQKLFKQKGNQTHGKNADLICLCYIVTEGK